MFPARDLPAIVNKINTTPGKSDNKKGDDEKRVFPLIISNDQCATICCLILILSIIALAIVIGLLSVFVPKPNDDNPTGPIGQTLGLTLVLPITQNTSNILSLNNSTLVANNYLDSAQCNILKSCLQTRLNLDDRTKTMTILSINSARSQYSGNNNAQVKKQQRIRRQRRRIRRQTSSLANQVEITATIQCNPLISNMACRQFIQAVLDNGQPLMCTWPNEVSTTLSSSLTTTTTTKVVIVVGQAHYWRQVGELFLAFGLASLIGLERQMRGKDAGLRTHSIVGTTSALVLQVSKYGFSDVIHERMIVLDPSRIAAQIISGVSFLGAGLIITRQAAIRGLTTAASVWSAAAIGMAAGSGLWVLSLAVTGLHFIIVLGFLPLEKRLPVFDKHPPFHRKTDSDDENDNNAQSV